MKKTGVRQMIFGILGSLACGVSVMGCYPLVPAYFTALYLEQVNGVVLLAFMYIGMTLFMPLTAEVLCKGCYDWCCKADRMGK